MMYFMYSFKFHRTFIMIYIIDENKTIVNCYLFSLKCLNEEKIHIFDLKKKLSLDDPTQKKGYRLIIFGSYFSCCLGNYMLFLFG